MPDLLILSLWDIVRITSDEQVCIIIVETGLNFYEGSMLLFGFSILLPIIYYVFDAHSVLDGKKLRLYICTQIFYNTCKGHLENFELRPN